MLIRNLVPMMVLGGITAHSGGAVKDRVTSALGLSSKYVARQRIGIILDAMTLQAASGDAPELHSQGDFRSWIHSYVRITGDRNADAALDPWGTPLKAAIAGGKVTITSAGADRSFGTGDDVSVTANIYDY